MGLIVDIIDLNAGAYADALRHPGKGGPEKQSLNRLEELGKRQNTQVNISNLIGIDILDQKHDKTDGKIDFVSSTQTTIISTQSTIINQVTQMQHMLKEKTEDKTGPKGKNHCGYMLIDELTSNRNHRCKTTFRRQSSQPAEESSSP
jgi:hypothetical protein